MTNSANSYISFLVLVTYATGSKGREKVAKGWILDYLLWAFFFT